MPARVDCRRTKHGRELLIDTAWVTELPTFLRDDPHALTFHNILLVTAGRGWFRLDGHRYLVAPGQVFFHGARARDSRDPGQALPRSVRAARGAERKLAVTPGHLHALCLRHLGRGAKQVIQDCLVLQARRALLHSDETVARIGDAPGFPDPSYFARFFRRETGRSPRASRAGRTASSCAP